MSLISYADERQVMNKDGWIHVTKETISYADERKVMNKDGWIHVTKETTNKHISSECQPEDVICGEYDLWSRNELYNMQARRAEAQIEATEGIF